MPDIIINNEVLTFNKIFYVDVINGDDVNGDGSKDNPYASLTKAEEVITSGNNEAVYLLSDIDYYNKLIYKSYNIISDQKTITCGRNADNPILFYSCGHFNIYRTIIKIINSAQWAYIGKSAGTANLEFYNCVILNDSSETTFDSYNCTFSYYFENCLFDCNTYGTSIANRTTPTVVNCATNRSSSYVSNDGLLNSVTYDSKYKITTAGWQNTGTGLNPDGSLANMGVYGGPYAWGVWATTYYLFDDGQNIKTYNYNTLSWENINITDQLAEKHFYNYGLTNLDVPYNKYKELGENASILTWTQDNHTELTCNVNGTINALSFLNTTTPKIMLWTSDLQTTNTVSLNAIPEPQLILPTDDIPLYHVKNFKGIILNANITGGGLIKLIVSVDQGQTWYAINTIEKTWYSIDITNLNNIRENGIKIEDIPFITETDWESLIGGSKFIRFGYYLEMCDITDNAETDLLQIKINLNGRLMKAEYEKEYEYEYSELYLKINLLQNGTYKINY